MTAEQIVRAFFEEVRSGRNPDYASQVMAEQVLAHQVISEEEVTVKRTPSDYAEHVREMIEAYGSFTLEIQEMITQGSKVYVRWKQTGTHMGQWITIAQRDSRWSRSRVRSIGWRMNKLRSIGFRLIAWASRDNWSAT